ncbi:MAG: hypothetical protein ACI4WG_07125 [Erysipelotrichaceae bacterium]
MKKLIILMMVPLLFFSGLSSVNAQDKSIERLNNIGQIDNSNEICQIIYEGKQSKVFYGENGIDIISTDGTVHFDTLYSVIKLICVNDVNADGYPDFLTYQNAAASSDQMFTISGKDGSVISSFRLTCSVYDSTLGTVQKNSYIYKMEVFDNRVFVLYDYSIVEVDLTDGTIVNSYTATNNIWDMLWYQGNIAFVDQDGYFGLLNGSDLSVIEKQKVANKRTTVYPYDDSCSYDIQMNLWDLFEYKGNLYFISEDGIIYRYDNESKEYPQYQLNVVDDTVLDLLLWDNNYYGSFTLQTGINNSWFYSYRVVEIKDNLALISCFFIDNESIVNYLDRETQCVVLYDLDLMEVVKVYDFKSVASRASVAFSQYTKDEQTIDSITVIYPSDNKMAVKVFDYSGEVLLQKELKVNASNNPKSKLTYQDDGSYLLEVYNDCVYEIDNSLTETKALFVRRKASLINTNNDQLVIAYKTNDVITGIVAYQNDGKTVNWQYDVKESRIHGAKSVSAADFNKDGIDDYIVLLDNYDTNDELVDTTVLILNGTDGSTLKDSRIYLYSAYDEKGKYVSYYAVVDGIELINDTDGDGKRELLINQGIVSSSNMALKGDINRYIDTKGTIKEIGDLNSDGIVDYVSISDTQMELYSSKITNRYEVDYQKTVTKKIDAKIKNSIYGTIFKDINNDGINEIILADYNQNGCQIFEVYDGKTLNYMYNLCDKQGASDYEVFGLLDFDLNNDGYNELLRFDGYYGYYQLIDGKTGKELVAFDYWSLENITDEEYEKSYHPSEPVYLYIFEDYELSKLFLINDVNNDGKNDLAIIKNYYDVNAYRTVSVIAVYDPNSFELLEAIEINSSRSEINEISKVGNSDKYLLYNTYEGSTIGLFDVQAKKDIASYSVSAMDGYMINDNTLLVSGMDNLYLLNTEPGFSLIGETDIVSDSNLVTISWQTNQPYSTITISESNRKIASTSEDSYQLALTEGSHLITVSCDDGQGKTTVKTIYITVTEQKRGGYYVIFAALAMFVIALVMNMYRKVHIKKLSKEEGLNG